MRKKGNYTLKFEVIETGDKWNKLVEKIRMNDVYYTYEYCNSSAQLHKGKAKLIYFETDLGIVIYPIISREIDSTLELKVYDIITPYGYGGPLIMGSKEILKDFRKVFCMYCKEESIVSEVITFHPLLKNASDMDGYCELQYVRKTTAVNLANDLGMIRAQYTGMNKRNIKIARKNGLVCKEVEKNKRNIQIFLKIYNETMDRQNATDFYYFPFEIIEKQLQDTPISKSHLLFVYYGDKVISATILFTTTHFSHYHLGASHIDYLYLRPNNLIFDYMIKISKTEGCTLLHLGGGYEDDDGLFKYKSSFTNNNMYDYYIGKNILDSELYNLLVDEKKQDYILKENYFPLYRSVN